MSFHIGDAVVHPHHGEGVVVEIRTRQIKGGGEIEFLKVKLKKSKGGLTVEIPASSLTALGVVSSDPEGDSIDAGAAGKMLDKFSRDGLTGLFIDQLGWDAPNETHPPIEMNDAIIQPILVAELKGFRVVAVPADKRLTRVEMQFIDNSIKVLSPERIVVFQVPGAWYWNWPTVNFEGKFAREYTETIPAALPRKLTGRLDKLRFTLDEHRRGFTLTDVRNRAIKTVEGRQIELEYDPKFDLDFIYLERAAKRYQIDFLAAVRRYIVTGTRLGTDGVFGGPDNIGRLLKPSFRSMKHVYKVLLMSKVDNVSTLMQGLTGRQNKELNSVFMLLSDELPKLLELAEANVAAVRKLPGNKKSNELANEIWRRTIEAGITSFKYGLNAYEDIEGGHYDDVYDDILYEGEETFNVTLTESEYNSLLKLGAAEGYTEGDIADVAKEAIQAALLAEGFYDEEIE